MSHTWIGLLMYTNLLLVGGSYFYIRQHRKLIGFQLGMNIAMVIGGLTALCTGILLISQYPFYFTPITMVSTFVGLTIGGVFGALFDYQTSLTGFANGVMMGMMAPMIGAVVEAYVPFILFIELLLIASLSVVLLSVKRS